MVLWMVMVAAAAVVTLIFRIVIHGLLSTFEIHVSVFVVHWPASPNDVGHSDQHCRWASGDSIHHTPSPTFCILRKVRNAVFVVGSQVFPTPTETFFHA